MLELELLEVDFLFIGSEAKIRRMVLAAFKLFLRNGDAKTWLMIGVLGVELRAETILEGAHWVNCR